MSFCKIHVAFFNGSYDTLMASIKPNKRNLIPEYPINAKYFPLLNSSLSVNNGIRINK